MKREVFNNICMSLVRLMAPTASLHKMSFAVISFPYFSATYF